MPSLLTGFEVGVGATLVALLVRAEELTRVVVTGLVDEGDAIVLLSVSVDSIGIVVGAPGVRVISVSGRPTQYQASF